jgi:hypothetical protein
MPGNNVVKERIEELIAQVPTPMQIDLIRWLG